MTNNLLDIRGLEVSIAGEDGPVQILRGVDLHVRKGEILGVIGESGSGKTMTGMALLRLLPSRAKVEAKTLRFDDTELPLLDAREFDALRGVRLAMIFQDPVGSFNPAKTIGWHFRTVFRRVGDEGRGDWRESAVALMRDVGILRAAESVDCYPHQLSGGMLQRALIALVLALQPELVIADEPTTNLDKLVERQILDLFRQMRTRLSAGIVFVTHDMAVAATLCDRIAVMKSGEVVETGTTEQVFGNPQHPYTRLLIDAVFALPRAGMAEPQPAHGQPVLAVRDLDLVFPIQRAGAPFHALKGISLELRQGEILGLVGESGSGKTTLGKTMLRLYRPTGGTLHLRGTDITHLGESELQPLRRQMQMVFQDPGGSFNPRRTIGEALAVALLTHDVCGKAEVEARITALLERVGLLSVHARRYPHELSGGQLQRAAIARALSVSPALIVADEAVSKLDVSIRAGVLELFRSIQAETGMSMIFITHDLEVARFLCHRVAVLYHGNLVEMGDTAEVFANPKHNYTKALLATLDHGLSGSAFAKSGAAPAQGLAS